jgi:hypothetical protein
MEDSVFQRSVTLFAAAVLTITAYGLAEETIGSDEPEQQAPLQKIERSQPAGNGFKEGSVYMNVGVMYASALIGAEFEFGLSRALGFEVGLGLVGANAGLNFHVLSKEKVDLYLSAAADYMPGLGAICPDFAFNVRGFFGQAARAGLCAKLGIAICTVNKSLTLGSTTLNYKKGMPMLTYSIGVPIKLKR